MGLFVSGQTTSDAVSSCLITIFENNITSKYQTSYKTLNSTVGTINSVPLSIANYPFESDGTKFFTIVFAATATSSEVFISNPYANFIKVY
jgi:hypothetical protein